MVWAWRKCSLLTLRQFPVCPQGYTVFFSNSRENFLIPKHILALGEVKNHGTFALQHPCETEWSPCGSELPSHNPAGLGVVLPKNPWKAPAEPLADCFGEPNGHASRAVFCNGPAVASWLQSSWGWHEWCLLKLSLSSLNGKQGQLPGWLMTVGASFVEKRSHPLIPTFARYL